MSNSPTPGSLALPQPGSQMLNARKITYAMMGVAGLLLLIGGAGLYTLNTRITAAQAVEATKQSQVGGSQQVANKYASTLADYNTAQGELRFLEKPTDANAYVPTLLPQIQKLAQSFGCQVNSMMPGALTSSAGPTTGAAAAAAASKTSTATDSGSQPDYQIMPLTLSLTGTYSQVMQFVYSLTRFPKMVTVKSITLHPSAGAAASAAQSKTQAVAVQIQLQAYVFPVDNYTSADPRSGDASSLPAKLATPTTTANTSSDVVDQGVNRAVKAALSVQSTSAERVSSAGFQAEPTPHTLPTNPNIGK